jgi:hypothetical protein
MNKQKMLMIGMFFLLVLTLVSASLVNDLSNQVKVSAVVKSPVQLTFSNESTSGPWFDDIFVGGLIGGVEQSFFLNERNYAEANIFVDDLVLNISESGYDNDCAVLNSFDLYKDNLFVRNLKSSCVVVNGDLMITLSDAKELISLSDDSYELRISFEQYAAGEYIGRIKHSFDGLLVSNVASVFLDVLPVYTNLPPDKSVCNDDWSSYTKLNGEYFTSNSDCNKYMNTNMCGDNGWKLLNYLYGSTFTNQGTCNSAGGWESVSQ